MQALTQLRISLLVAVYLMLFVAYRLIPVQPIQNLTSQIMLGLIILISVVWFLRLKRS